MKYKKLDIAYLNGVLVGDGWCSTERIGLRAKDNDFVQAFCNSLNKVFSTTFSPQQDERGYWIVRTSNKSGKFDSLLNYKEYVPATDAERAKWLCGLFDSEGNACLSHQPQLGPNSYSRRVAFYNTEKFILERAALCLAEFDIATAFRTMKNSQGHRGRKKVYELRLRCNKNHYEIFSEVIGSNIKRKQKTLKAIVRSYKPDLSAHCREAQLKGARIRHEKTMRDTLPKVIEGVRELIEKGIKPTQKNCRSIQGYNSIQRYIRQKDLIDMAIIKE